MLLLKKITYTYYVIILSCLFFSPIILSMHVVQKQSHLLSFLENLSDTSDKIVVHCDTINLLKPSLYPFTKDFNFANIGHLDLTVNGPFTLHYALKVPSISLHVNGPLTLGKSNDEMGIIAATHSPLTISAYAIDGRYGKFYGKGKTLIESTLGDITIGAPTRGIDLDIKRQYIEKYCPWVFNLERLKRQFRPDLPEQSTEEIVAQQPVGFDCTVNQRNSAYAASDTILTLKSAANIFIQYGALCSTLKNHLIAQKEIRNLSGKISSQGTTVIEADSYHHTREGVVDKPRCGDYQQYPGSGPALLESLEKIVFVIKNKIHNLAGSIRSGQDIAINGLPLQGNPSYTEEVQNFYTHGNWNVNGNPDAWAYQYILTLTQSCTTQSGGTIQMNLGDFTITGNMNAAGKIAITGNSGSFANTSLSRDTVNCNGPRIVNVTKFLQEQAQQPGILCLGDDNSVRTEFSVGESLHPHPHGVLLENDHPAPLNWPSLFNPLNAINLDLYVQQLLSTFAGKVSAGKARGNNLSAALWANANQWKNKHHKEIMSQEDLQHVNQSMLLTQILNTGTTEEQHTLLCIAPQDINPYQSQGDIVGEDISCITQKDQTHQNTREIATGPEGITLQSQTGAIALETQSYTVSYQTDEKSVIEQRAMPQQQLIAPAGPVTIKADKNITRTGTLLAAATDIIEQSDHGSITKNPLVLQRIETHHEEKRGWFSSSHTTHTNTTHHAISCETHSGATLHDKAATNICAIASRDVADTEIIYEAPHTTIEGLLVANKTTHSTHTSSIFSDRESNSSKETPYAVSATINAPRVRFKGEDAQVNATITGTELHDETEKGVRFVAKVAQMLCSEQTLIESPLFSADVGYEAGYETMIQPMLLVEKIIRSNKNGSMLFESAIIDKNRTQIIGNFVETTYQLKNWQRSWNNVSQVIPDEALVVIALAVALATEGAGVEFLASVLENVTAATGMQLSAAGVAAVNAGFSAVCSTATASALKTGDLISTAEHLTSPQYLKSLTCTMASAGLCAQLGSMLDIDMNPGIKSLPAHLQEQAVRSTVDTLLNIGINDASVDEALGDMLKHITIKSVAAYLSNQLCTTYLDTISNTAAQTVVGGATGFAMDQSRKGLVSGATGALTAEMVGNLILSDSHAIIDSALTNLNKRNTPLTEENIKRAIAKEIHQKVKWAKVAAAGVAAITKQNTNIAIATATNAIDNDVALRGTFYAMAEFQKLVSATSEALVSLYLHKEDIHTKAPLKKESAKKIIKPNQNVAKKTIHNDKAYDLVLTNIQKSTNPNTYRDLILQCAQEKGTMQSRTKESLYDRIVTPQKSPFIKETSAIIRVAFADAVHKTVHVFSFVPNPLGMACCAGETGWDIYQKKTNLTSVAFNIAAGYGLFKGAQAIGKGAKMLYQKGSGTIKNITDSVCNKIHQWRYARQGKVSFVENPRAGQWRPTEATIANDLMLTCEMEYIIARSKFIENNKGPFNVVGHANAREIFVEKFMPIHPKGLSKANLLQLEEKGIINLNAIQLARLIRTAPEYKKGQHINLFACSAGAKRNGIAQQLATRMNVPVSAFTKTLSASLFGELFCMEPGINNFGVMKTFYPQKNIPYCLIALASFAAFILKGDEAVIQDVDVSDVITNNIYHSDLDDEWMGSYPRLGLDEH